MYVDSKGQMKENKNMCMDTLMDNKSSKHIFWKRQKETSSHDMNN